MCIIENATFGFEDKILAKNVNLKLFYRDKVAIVGPNGCGKTTLLRIMNKELTPLAGSVKMGASLNIGFYDQLHLRLNDKLTVKETIWQSVPTAEKGYVLGYLAKFGFTKDNVEKEISILSGGEKARLYLAKLIHEKPNFLILDEPTNHLDLDMIDSLEKALSNYNGTIVFVSHDRYFIKKMADKKWSFQNNNIVETTASLEEIFAQQAKNGFPRKKSFQQPKKAAKKKTNPIILKQKIQIIDSKNSDLEKLEVQLNSLHEEFNNNEIYSNPLELKKVNKKVKKLERNISDLKEEIDRLEEEYLELLQNE
ncbi:MAG: ATP-binding cassette domain-containing protein [Candidatus Cloacimonadota bacterium]|nr:ATP-binding cassette domain-containing protein [Candidatus Cloacimonadota bacterium]